MSPTSYELHILLGIHGRTEKVARALVIPGSTLFHGNEIPPNYARVEVVSVEPKHAEERIDIAMPEGIEFLGQCVNQFILWNKLYILNLAPLDQQRPIEQRQLALEHAYSDPPIQEFMPATPPDVAEKVATPPEVVKNPTAPPKVVEKPATPLDVPDKPPAPHPEAVENPAPSKQPPEPEEQAVAQTCDNSVLPKMVRAYEKGATEEVQKWFTKTVAGKKMQKPKKKEPQKRKRPAKKN